MLAVVYQRRATCSCCLLDAICAWRISRWTESELANRRSSITHAQPLRYARVAGCPGILVAPHGDGGQDGFYRGYDLAQGQKQEELHDGLSGQGQVRGWYGMVWYVYALLVLSTDTGPDLLQTKAVFILDHPYGIHASHPTRLTRAIVPTTIVPTTRPGGRLL